MFIPYFQKTYFFFALLLLSTASFGEMYKWVDEKGQTHYSQQAPKDQQAELIKAPPPPAISPTAAQKEIDTLIEKQNGTFEENEKQRQNSADEIAEQKKKEEYCNANRHNLEQFQNNPGNRLIDAEGTVTRPTEEERLQKIDDIQKNITEHCQ